MMDEDELQLPTLPKSQSEPQLPHTPSVLRLNSRKRSARSYELQDEDVYSSSLHTSSDPALFSSDETPDAENYSGGKRRKKKTYAGTWWGERHGHAGSAASSSSGGRRKTKRKFTRNFDSGVFMCSDDGSTDLSSDSSFGAELLEDQKRAEEMSPAAPLRTPPRSKLSSIQNVASPRSPRSPRFVKRPTVVDSREQQVLAIVRKCVEKSKEDIDLSGISLESLPPETREIATMVKDDPSNLIRFDSLVARPRLYLSNNLFRQFPTPVLELNNLRLLSLRQNKLTYIPSGIRNLVKLETLNISGNRLQSIPIEVLDLMSKHRLAELHCDPNPWLTPSSEHIQYITDNPRHDRISAQLRFYSADQPGQPVPLHAWHTPLTLTASTFTSSDPARQKMPSLTELILRQLSRLNSTRRDLTSIMPENTPPSVLSQLQDLHCAQNDGGRRCVNCGREFVRAAMKWTEWWDIMVNGTRSREDCASGHVVRHDELDDLKRAFPVKTSLVLPFEVAACGSCT